jgi:curved DNA-binding protein CbpA
MNPYLVLGVATNASDQTIREAYLNGIKAATPESDPKRFQALNLAYEKIKDESNRLQYLLFDRDCPAESPLAALPMYARYRRQFDPVPFDKLKEFLRSQAAAGGK